jgi:Putative auto-transporter adhesin, head GIN domain
MKTTILTIAIALATVFGISQSSYAAASSNEEITTLTDISKISKIEVHGNVELYVSDGTADQVKVYNRYYTESALVQDPNGVLRISSYKTQKLVVWVTVSDLRNLSVYDNAEVRSFGKLSAIDLDVKLFNSASAQLNMDAYQATVTLNDHAKADLAGTINDGEVRYDQSSSVNITGLVAAHLVKKVNFERNDAADLASL